MLLALPHRQAVQWPLGAAASRGAGRGSAALGFVFTIPKALRVFLRYDQRLFGLISRLIFSLIAGFYSAAAGKPIASAASLAYQPFGDALRLNPNFHALILEGGFDPDGQFYFLPIHESAPLAQLPRQRTVGLFLKLDLITGPPLGHPCPRRH